MITVVSRTMTTCKGSGVVLAVIQTYSYVSVTRIMARSLERAEIVHSKSVSMTAVAAEQSIPTMI